ncbi:MULTISPECIES: glycosyltransferase [unclassified Sulfuricurvum]|uniref:glycosyltransferase n=1 Tax=unclassified Sulfuricurvum TaxID=2632390 RepID=UPI0002996D29|nr:MULTISPECIES: glycosyltransferase [unclassified Sulfuricurvum]AFV98296.1 putative glycosyltransferase [Candidatus Sulfuricurvum sp. RIFRC-1]HBM34825.1 glycosyl transferase family 2 [Sulfuricurvum sp.]
MELPKTTIIISVYKDTEALGFILDSLANQTLPADEIIVSEDGDSSEMREFIATQQDRFPNLVHLTQPDDGWWKNKAMNSAIQASSNEYLIFIDGDCVPYSTFIQAHAENAQKGIVLCGKRFELGPKFTERVKQHELTVRDIEKKFFWYLPFMITDDARHPEDGLTFKSHSFISRQIHKRYVRHIIGCNWSCYKEDFLKINGFDETYRLPAEGEDVDPSWRFRGMGIELKSCRNNANILHLYHPKRFSAVEGDVNKVIMEKHRAENAFYCKDGITKL